MKCQAGFRSKTRTTDHMFILKCLVDNYTNSKGNKLYACFVDFKRAFYTVIHPGMRISSAYKRQSMRPVQSDTLSEQFCKKIGKSCINKLKREGFKTSPWANSANELQERLNALVSYCDTWCLNVNLKKT
jgi:hypothetical protein